MSAKQRPPGPPPRLKNRYRLVRWLGEGSMGAVYRAHDETLGRDVAIKFLLPEKVASGEASARFLREARAVAGLAHPNILTLYDVDRQGDWHYLVLEYVPGQDLHALMLERGGPLPLRQALLAARGALNALAYAHGQGVLHRDVKPENIMLTPDGQVRLTDFGLALARGEARLTQQDVLVGTVLYLAPEVIQGQPPGDRADLYALGAVLYELLTGQPPFGGDTPQAALAQILSAPLASPRSLNQDVPARLERVILRLLARDPADRYASAQEALADLPEAGEAGEAAGAHLSLLERVARGSSAAHPRPALSAAQELLVYAAQQDTAAAVEAERRRLAGQLQGSVIEQLQLLLAQAHAYEQTLGADPTGHMAVSVLASLARQALQEARDLQADLHPATLETLGLEPALEALANQATRAHGLQVRLRLERLPQRLPPPVELALFRAAQEALSARRRHASQVDMRLARQGERLVLSLSDDGPMRDRVFGFLKRIEQLGGSVQSGAGPGGGLELRISLPLAEPAQLTPREMDVIQLLTDGLSNKEIARALFISPRTVNFHLDNIYSKLGVSSRTEAAIYALRQGWIKGPG
jgi:signal transduction histidine kinase